MKPPGWSLIDLCVLFWLCHGLPASAFSPGERLLMPPVCGGQETVHALISAVSSGRPVEIINEAM